MLDFPDSPTVGLVYTLGSTNLRWYWDGTAWRRYASLSAGSVIDVIEGLNFTVGALVVTEKAV